MEIRRVAVIYDDRERPETTGVYCRRALESLVEVVHFRPDALATIPDHGFDLYLNIDDSLAYHLPAGLHPCAWWAIDTHLNFEWCREKAAGFDLVFAAQRDGAARLEAEGIAPAQWLPLACDPEIHRRHEVEKLHDVAFVGNIFPGPRAELLERLHRRRTARRSCSATGSTWQPIARPRSCSTRRRITSSTRQSASGSPPRGEPRPWPGTRNGIGCRRCWNGSVGSSPGTDQSRRPPVLGAGLPTPPTAGPKVSRHPQQRPISPGASPHFPPIRPPTRAITSSPGRSCWP
jgi:hypothetical protein